MRSEYGSKNGLRIFAFVLAILVITRLNAETGKPIEIENQYVKYVIGTDGSNVSFIDKQSGTDYCLHQGTSKFAKLNKDGNEYSASAVSFSDNKLTVQFGDSGVSVVIGVTSEEKYFTFEILSISDTDVKEMVFIDVPLSCQGTLTEPFQSCVLALTLQANVDEIPGPSSQLRAICRSWPGIIGAKVAIIGCPKDQLRNVMKEAISSAKEIPQTNLGGPWAMDAELNRGSYLIDFPGGISEKNVDGWITVVKSLGATQIDLHTGQSTRFGDYEPNLAVYPNGLESVKAVIDKLHAAGISAGLHTYAFFIAKNSKWVSPVPDPRLAKAKVFTLSSALSPEATNLPVDESTKNISTITGFQVRNSVTVQIDDELITFSDVKKEQPYAFTGCQRGACGTKVSAHEKGAKVYQLKECFGLFVPDSNTTLFMEVAARTAEVYNKCGFDMIYLDALDGADILTSRLGGWQYYSTKFVYELCNRLERPALMEMSSFNHSLWFVRSRINAWDAPSKGYKRFIDKHAGLNKESGKILLPTNLGWWCVFDWSAKDRARTFPDDIEYIMCKALALDSSLSWLMGFEPNTFPNSHNAQKLASIIKQYEQLRLSNYFSESTREKLSAANNDFTLEKTADNQWQFRAVKYDQHKVLGIDGSTNIWKTQNQFAEQPVKVRIEALLSLAPYDSSDNLLADYKDPNEFLQERCASDVLSIFTTVSSPLKSGSQSACFTAKSNKTNKNCAWTMVGKKFSPLVNLLEKGFGVWIYGDGKGEVLNFQWTQPGHLAAGVSEHYAVIDFTGWRYFEFIESESERLMDYGWPYFYSEPDTQFTDSDKLQHFGIHKATFWVDYANLDSLSIWYNNIPKGEKVKCYLSPIKALAHVKSKLINPSIEIGGKTIIFPTELESGSYLEFRSMSDCKVYDAKGELLSEIKPLGDAPTMTAGENQIKFNYSTANGVSARANVTIINHADKVIGK